MRAHAGSAYPADPQFLWNQPFSDSGLVKVNATATAVGAKGTNGGSVKGSQKGATNGSGPVGGGSWGVLGVVVASVSALLVCV